MLGGAACNKKNKGNTDNPDQPAIDEQIITAYIADNKLTAKATGSGLYYVVDAPGANLQPAPNSDVKVAYKGYFTNGTMFDESSAEGIVFNLKDVIKGWQEGIPLFKKGGKGKLLIPSALAYGNKATGKIPANSVLVFDIELLDVK